MLARWDSREQAEGGPGTRQGQGPGVRQGGGKEQERLGQKERLGQLLSLGIHGPGKG